MLSVGGHAMMYGGGVKQKLCKMACIGKFVVISANVFSIIKRKYALWTWKKLRLHSYLCMT